MTSQLVNELYGFKHCQGVYKQNSIVNSVRGDDWTAEWAIIASNDFAEFLVNIRKLEKQEFRRKFLPSNQSTLVFVSRSMRHWWHFLAGQKFTVAF